MSDIEAVAPASVSDTGAENVKEIAGNTVNERPRKDHRADKKRRKKDRNEKIKVVLVQVGTDCFRRSKSYTTPVRLLFMSF